MITWRELARIVGAEMNVMVERRIGMFTIDQINDSARLGREGSSGVCAGLRRTGKPDKDISNDADCKRSALP
jgi:hypothetical protein